jgi:hypothetical protein
LTGGAGALLEALKIMPGTGTPTTQRVGGRDLLDSPGPL